MLEIEENRQNPDTASYLTHSQPSPFFFHAMQPFDSSRRLFSIDSHRTCHVARELVERCHQIMCPREELKFVNG
jgi:hypothetical protein